MHPQQSKPAYSPSEHHEAGRRRARYGLQANSRARNVRRIEQSLSAPASRKLPILTNVVSKTIDNLLLRVLFIAGASALVALVAMVLAFAANIAALSKGPNHIEQTLAFAINHGSFLDESRLVHGYVIGADGTKYRYLFARLFNLDDVAGAAAGRRPGQSPSNTTPQRPKKCSHRFLDSRHTPIVKPSHRPSHLLPEIPQDRN